MCRTYKMANGLVGCIDDNLVSFSVFTGMLSISVFSNFVLTYLLCRTKKVLEIPSPDVSPETHELSHEMPIINATAYDLPSWVVSSFRKDRASVIRN